MWFPWKVFRILTNQLIYAIFMILAMLVERSMLSWSENMCASKVIPVTQKSNLFQD
jgi:hypothetical protein